LKTLPTIEAISERLNISNSTQSSISPLIESDINIETPKHLNEKFDLIPGACITTGSVQEHLTATRPVGFFSFNKLDGVNLLRYTAIHTANLNLKPAHATIFVDNWQLPAASRVQGGVLTWNGSIDASDSGTTALPRLHETLLGVA
jgi:hypothetical protein